MALPKSRKGADSAAEGASASAAQGADVFDVDRVRKLVELMQEFDLSLVDLKQGGQRVRLRRGADSQATATPLPAAAPSAPAVAPLARPAEAVAPSPSKKTVAIKSPMVGTFYASPKPDAPAYVKVGDMVAPDTVVCIIEAMKVFNELPAEVSGRIVAVVAETGAPVEYGQTLFEVEPR